MLGPDDTGPRYWTALVRDHGNDRQHQDRNDVCDFNHRIDRRASRIFVRFANGIAGYCRFVSVKALAAAIAVFDVLLGVIPCITTGGNGVSDKQAGYDRAEAKAAKRLWPGLK